MSGGSSYAPCLRCTGGIPSVSDPFHRPTPPSRPRAHSTMTDQYIAPLAPSSSANTPTEPGEVFVPLSQIVEKGEEEVIVEMEEEGVEGEMIDADPPARSARSVPKFVEEDLIPRQPLKTIRRARKALPALADALALGSSLAQENKRLRAEVIALRMSATMPPDNASLQLAQQIIALQGKIRRLEQALKASKERLGNTQLTGNDKAVVSSVKQADPSPRRTIDPDRISSLAIALIEDAEPNDIATLLLDEVDRVVMDGKETEGGEDGMRGGVGDGEEVDSRSVTPNKAHEIEGVLEVTLGRVAQLEADVRYLQGHAGV
ncbi:hypothetical protein DB88DRAFT_483889 [Papiliotrema laurentii]|uniref:Uncharacterized protein n=1 Tax=Papiliotrema laurentii TaxID=5418 RepID=A0AAD9FSL7_PAPLA|nr:hypothetical protein DB88DRAFT_483889 [Papiliotrema laurentii]